MKVEYLKKDDAKVKFALRGVNFTIANAVRRAIMSYVPSMAVDRVTVYENSSPLFEEMIAQRLGLVPLTTDLDTYDLKDECKCEGKGCARCEASFILEKTGPGTLYSGDMKPQDPKTKPVFDKIPIVKLGENQKVRMEMVAKLGFMTEHAKFQPGLASYKQINDTDFEFFAESYNNLKAKELVETAIENLAGRIDELDDAIAGEKKKRSRKAAKKK